MMELNKILESGRYILIYRYDEIPLEYINIRGLDIPAVHNGKEKMIHVNDMKVDHRTGRVKYDITIKNNPIPIALVGVVLAGATLFGTFGYALDEVQETVDKTWPIIILLAGVWVYTLYKTR